jgi:hypothetical protein
MPIYPGIVASAAEVAGGPGATPAWGSAGAVASSSNLANGGVAHTIAHPATVAVGDLLQCIAFARNGDQNAAVAMHANMAAAGWAHITGSPWTWTGGGRMLLVARKYAVGNEGGTNIPGGIVGSGGTTSDGFIGVCVRWTAADGFRSPNAAESISIAQSVATTRSMPTVTPAGANRRGVAIIAVASLAQNLASATGETGGDWAEVFDAEGVAGTGTIQIQSADLSGGGAISGGSSTSSNDADAFILGFALVPTGG